MGDIGNKLPDGEILTKARLHTLKTGYDHYLRLHADADAWSEFCPICREQITELRLICQDEIVDREG